MRKYKNYLIVYNFKNHVGSGFGNIPIKIDYDIYKFNNIRKIENEIAQKYDYENVAILNIIPLND